MGWLARGIERKSSSDSYGVFADAMHSMLSSKAGVVVSREQAFKVGVVFCCLRVIAEGVAQVPFKVMRKTKTTISRHPMRDDADDHPLFDLLYRQPNSWQTSYEFRETMAIHAGLSGSAYAFKNVINVGTRGPRVAELILLDPARVTPTQKEDWSIEYQVRSRSGQMMTFPQEAIWHVRGPSWNGVMGVDILRIAREAIGLSIATEESQAKLHANGVRPSGVYSVEGTLNETQYGALKKFINQEYAGATNSGGVMLLDRSAKFLAQTMTGVDAQHLETRRHQIEEVCRFFRVLPIMVGYSDKAATYATAEQMFLAHVVHTLMPWYERIQQSADVNLLSASDRAAGYYTKLQESGLLRGAMKDTSEYLYRLSMGGIMERNEARGKLDLNPLDGLDEPLTPVNMTTDPSGAAASAATGA